MKIWWRVLNYIVFILRENAEYLQAQCIGKGVGTLGFTVLIIFKNRFFGFCILKYLGFDVISVALFIF